MKASWPAVLVATTAVALLGPAWAHHSHATLDRDDIRVLTGRVTYFGWNMPHVFIRVEAPNPEGRIVEYSIEMGSPPSLARAGWARETLKPGDIITWQGPHHRDKTRAYSGVTWVEKDGARLGTDPVVVDAEVYPSTDFTGVWARNDPGGFTPHYFPPEAWPYTELAQALVDAFDEEQNPMLECIDPGPPKSTLLPYPHRITRPDDRTILIERDLLSWVRVVHLDHSIPPGEPSVMGHSIGWFEGGELVVETTNFVPDRWGTHTGVDSSEHKHLLERYRLIEDGMGLVAEITVTDPVYLTEPHTFRHYWSKLPDRDLVQALCTLEASRLWIEGGTN